MSMLFSSLLLRVGGTSFFCQKHFDVIFRDLIMKAFCCGKGSTLQKTLAKIFPFNVIREDNQEPQQALQHQD